jgi:hypothetical protein
MTAMKERAKAPGMSEADKLAAAMEYAQKTLTGERGLALVFQRSPKTGKSLTPGQIFAEVDFDTLWGTDFSEHLAEDDLERTYLKGDKEATRTLIDEAIKYLHEPGLKLASDRIEVLIKEFVVGVLEDKRRDIARKRGRKVEINTLRNRFIVHVVKGVCTYGFEPTRNEASRNHESGCSIVAAVLAERGLNLTEGAIAKIWEKRLV